MRVSFTDEELHLAVGNFSAMLRLMASLNGGNVYTPKQDKYRLVETLSVCADHTLMQAAPTLFTNGVNVVL